MEKIKEKMNQEKSEEEEVKEEYESGEERRIWKRRL